jgi:pseudouridine kinase
MKRIAVIGNIFVDVKGMSFAPVHKDAKNIGKAVFVHGGVGRNVAQNLGALGQDTTFISTVTNNAIGKEVIDLLNRNGVNTDYVTWCEEDGMGIWVAVLDPNGDLVASISHQPNHMFLEQTVNNHIEEVVNQYDGIAIDVDITYTITKKTIEVCRSKGKPVYGVVGNLGIVKRNPELLKGLSCFVCSREEATILLGKDITNVNDALEAVRSLATAGAPLSVITLGEMGSVYYDIHHHQGGYIPANAVEVKDTTGAGDAYFAGLVASLLAGESVENAMKHGTETAAKVLQSNSSALIRHLT